MCTTVPSDMDVKMKAILIGAVFLIVSFDSMKCSYCLFLYTGFHVLRALNIVEVLVVSLTMAHV